MAAEAEFGQRPLDDVRKSELYVRIGFEGKPTSFRLIPRVRLSNPKTVNATFACEAEFFVEASTGNILLPQDWQEECAPPPEGYYVKAKVWPELEPDSLEQDEYRGSVQLVADFVPPEVDSRTLTCWLLAGLDDDDPEWVATRVGLEEAREDMRKAQDLIDSIPNQHIPGVKTVAEEVAIKKKRLAMVAAQLEDARAREKRMAFKVQFMQSQRDDPLNTPFILNKVHTHKPIESCTWTIDFANATEGARLAYLATHKYNWADFKVAFHKFRSKPPLSTKSHWDPMLPGDFQEVNMRGVRVVRRKHGKGMFKFPDDRGYYSGGWLRGLRHGLGVQLNLSGKFMGHFKRERRRGRGTQVFANGDLARGTYACPKRRLRASLLQGDEYCDGLLEGHCSLRFTDGSRYEGEVRQGVPNGKGKYIDSQGGVMEGTFKDGMLHGTGMRSFADVNQLGVFRYGELHGQGTSADLTLGRMEGRFERGLLQGHGEGQVSLIQGTFSGYFLDGFRNGFGELSFLNVDRDERQEAAKLQRREALHAMTAKELKQQAAAKGGSTPGPAADLTELAKDTEPAAARGEGGQLKGVSSMKEYEEVQEAKARRRRARREKRQARFNRFVRGGGAAAVGALGEVGASSDSDSGSSSDEDVYGRTRGAMSKYDKFDDYPLPYKGDFGYEGRFRAGQVWGGGVFIARKGKPPHHAHFRYFAHRLKNVALPPELTVLPAKEARVEQGRARIRRNTAADIVSRRLTKEAENLKSYKHWRKVAKMNMTAYRTRNREMQEGVRGLKQMLLGEGASLMWDKAAGKAGVQDRHEQQQKGDGSRTSSASLQSSEGFELYDPAKHGEVVEDFDEDDGELGGAEGGFAHASYGETGAAEHEYSDL